LDQSRRNFSKLTPSFLKVLLLAGTSLLVSTAAAQTIALEPLVVSADRTPESASQVAASVTTLDADTLQNEPALTVDDALLSVPGFSLFRRDGSLTANPTTQGVSLRGMGPSGASRSLVLLDGIPLNDPFGGWITWSQIPRESLAGAEIVEGGGATAWGNSALSGVVQLLTDPASGDRERLFGSVGDYDTRSAEMEVTEPVGNGTVQILGEAFSTDGYRIVAPEDAGPIDAPASSQHSWITARWREPLGDNIEMVLTLHTFEESRDNGTPYEKNWTRENSSSLVLNGKTSGDFSWTGAVYAQNGDFASTYSSVNLARTAETPAEDQYAVPDTALGGAWTGSWRGADESLTSVGFDIRDVRGETREDYSFANGSYADQRFAGGRQTFYGIFALREQPVAPGVRISFGVRLDDWLESAGHLRESVLATGAPLEDDEYPDRSGQEFSPSVGIIWQAAPELRLRADAEQAFRVPTLNELYRPFRQGNNITEANPDLKTEHATTGEIGADWTPGSFQIGVTGFASELMDAVDAVTVATGPANVPGIGVIPAGGSGLERLNLDRVDVEGAQTYVEWKVSKSLRFRADYLFDDTNIVSASVAPDLVGHQLVQVPKNSATFGASWSAPGEWVITPRVRWIGTQFNDDENQMPLESAVVADLSVSRRLGAHAQLFITIENLGNTQIQTGLSTTGVISTGEPRMTFGGIRLDY
jgi:outer membrane receptor protein involved in Fe transport